jgi:hypothetical protein
LENYPSDEETARFTKEYLLAALKDNSYGNDPNDLEQFNLKTIQKVFDFSRIFIHVNGDLIGDRLEQAAQDLWDTQVGNDRRGPDLRLSEITGKPFREQEMVGFIHHPEIWNDKSELLARIGRTLGHTELIHDHDGLLQLSGIWTTQ